MRSYRFFAALALACPAALFGGDPEISALREEIKVLREQYETRLRALEERLKAAETKAVSVAQPAPAAPPSAPSREAAFNPAISLILQGTYSNLSKDPDTFQFGGFIPPGDELGPGRRGFSLRESELNLSASVDPYFLGHLTAALSEEDEIEVEEAYLQTLALGRGFTLKAGRFFSGVGYLNELHQHAFDFVDFPLPYEAFFGGNYADDGVQVKWVAPIPFFLEVGAELGRGRSFPGSDRDKNGSAAGALYAHLGGDVGVSHSWRAGLSYLDASAEEREFEDIDSFGAPVLNAFSGGSKTWIADFIWKWAPDGNYRARNFKVQGEYFRRKEDGELSFDDSAGAGALGFVSDRYSSRQSGWYLQGVYQFLPRWRIGLRYDRLDSDDIDIGLVQSGVLTPADFPLLASHDPTRKAIMFDFSPSEFSRLRLQYARDESRFEGTDHQWFLQYIMSLGPHGAHRF